MKGRVYFFVLLKAILLNSRWLATNVHAQRKQCIQGSVAFSLESFSPSCCSVADPTVHLKAIGFILSAEVCSLDDVSQGNKTGSIGDLLSTRIIDARVNLGTRLIFVLSIQ